MNLIERVLNNLEKRRERAISGLYNCIPLPFPRFRNWFPGFEKSRYILITANQKIGKSKLSDYLAVYELIFFIIEHPEVRAKILYFTLEMSAEEKYLEFLSHLLARLDGIEISTSDLKSTNKDKPVDSKIFDLIKSDRYRPYIEKFEETIIYIDNISNPTGINKYCREFALNRGKLFYKKGIIKDKDGNVHEGEVIDYFQLNDPEEYLYVILDNASNLSSESGMNKMETIDKMSKYAITLKKQLEYVFILIQHQAQAQEGVENKKLNEIKPSAAGLADCKTTIRDVDLAIGLYSPFKYGITQFEGYDITKFRNYIRFMEVMEDRHYGAGGQICPLFFNGATSTFIELPRPENKEELEQIYKYIDSLNKKKITSKALMIISKLKNKIK